MSVIKQNIFILHFTLKTPLEITFLSPPPGLYRILSKDPILDRMFFKFGFGASPTVALIGGNSRKKRYFDKNFFKKNIHK